MSSPVTVRIPKELLKFIEHFDGKTRSEKLRNYLSSSIIQKGMIEHKIKEYEHKIEVLKEKLNSNIFANIHNLSEEEIEYIKKDSEFIEKYGHEYVEGKCGLFNSKFGRGVTISDYRVLLNQWK